NGNCVGSAYTRTDSWSDLIIQVAKTAASLGGYAPPAWTTPVPPDPDAGPGPGKDGGGPASDGGGSGSGKALGEACGGNDECASNSCASLGDSPQICTQPCDGAVNTCPSGYACTQGYCFVSSSGGGGGGLGKPGAQPTSTTTTSGCGVAPDPT